jgi:hypothetical protein
MLPVTKRVLGVAAIIAAGAFTGVSTAHASTTAARAFTIVAAPAAGHPTTKIEGSGKALKWAPNKLKAKHAAGTCSSTNYSFKVVNTTSASQTITYKGAAIGAAIPAGATDLVCGSEPGNAVLALKADAKAHLTVSLS